MLQIAGGIVIAVLFFAFLPLMLAILVLTVMLVVAVAISYFVALKAGVPPDQALSRGLIGLAGVVGISLLAGVVEKYQKKLEADALARSKRGPH